MRMWTRLHSTKGQMALMVALIFQVLFVFFAMIINVGLVVHDKIVVQNATDLGAYYGAQRQAEILNHLAHINYQIRQANKLLAFRYWVTGTMGYDKHPLRDPSVDTQDKLFVPKSVSCSQNPVASPCMTERNRWEAAEYPSNANFSDIFKTLTDYVPSVCVAHDRFANFSFSASNNSTYCKEYKLQVPNIPIFNLSGGVHIDDLRTSIDAVRQAFTNECKKFGSLNWAFAAKIYSIYKYDIQVRRRMFDALAENLKLDGKDLSDLSGEPQSVLKGIRNTIQKNLPSSTELVSVEFLNSPSKCTGGKELFHPNVIVPDVYWMDAIDHSTSTSAGSCETVSKSLVSSQPGSDSRPNYRTEFSIYDPNLDNFVKSVGSPKDMVISGYEKNPWCMIYSGVRVKVRSRKLFSPFGQPTEMTAESFAQPFGSTIGPWTYETWTPSSDRSNNTNYDKRTDHMLPYRADDGGNVTPRPINYSRYPGDQLGMASRQAQGAFAKLVQGPTNKFDFAWFKHWDNIRDFDTVHGDPLVYDANGAADMWRKIEIAAVAPDRFDQMYYNIDADYWGNYLKETAGSGKFTGLTAIVGDYGTNKVDNKMAIVSVGRSYNSSSPQLDYIEPLRQAVTSGGSSLPVAPYVLGAATPLESIGSLLTWFKTSGAYSYEFNDSTLGRCASGALGQDSKPTFGACIEGGRTGYSVRIVNRQFLESDKHKLGGANSPTSGILNKPSF